jgi:hypothetical protein
MALSFMRGGRHRGRRVIRRAWLVMGLVAVIGAGAAFIQARGDGVIRPDDPCASPVPLVTRGGVTLQPIAMQAFREAERLAGRSIAVIQSYRSCARQARACQSICRNPEGCPGLCAPPGLSYHQIGAAVDISQATLETPRIKQALEEAGWCQSVPLNDPGHFSFGGCH